MEDRAPLTGVAMTAAEFDAFYDSALPVVYGYVFRLCGSADDAWDLTQDVWMALVDQLANGERDRATVPWLLTVARNRYLDLWRRNRRLERMSERHRELSLPVDPDQAEELRQRLHARLFQRDGAVSDVAVGDDSTTYEEILMPNQPDSSGMRRYAWIGAAAVIVAAIVAVTTVLMSRHDSPASTDTPTTVPAPGPVDTTTAVPTTTTTTTTVPATTTLPPLPDDQIATSALLTPEEYHPSFVAKPWAEVVMDGEVAATIPECASFLDAFSSPGRQAQEAFTWFWTPEPPDGALSQYVVVFPDEATATKLFETLEDPALGACAGAYAPAIGPLGSRFSPIRAFDLEPAQLTLPGDQVSVRRFTETNGDTVGILRSTLIREGRVVVMLESAESDPGSADKWILTDEQLTAAVSRIVERIDSALAGRIPT